MRSLHAHLWSPTGALQGRKPSNGLMVERMLVTHLATIRSWSEPVTFILCVLKGAVCLQSGGPVPDATWLTLAGQGHVRIKARSHSSDQGCKACNLKQNNKTPFSVRNIAFCHCNNYKIKFKEAFFFFSLYNVHFLL